MPPLQHQQRGHTHTQKDKINISTSASSLREKTKIEQVALYKLVSKKSALTHTQKKVRPIQADYPPISCCAAATATSKLLTFIFANVSKHKESRTHIEEKREE